MGPDNNQQEKPQKLADQTSEQLLTAWTEGDEAAGQILVDRYLTRLIALVRSRLARRFAARFDPEDVVFSAWRSFFVAARAGMFGVADDGGIWSLLATITLRKLSKSVKHHSAQRRSVSNQQSALSLDLAPLVAADATTEQAAIVEEELALIFQKLTAEESKVLSLRLDGLTQPEIAQRIGKSERTIRRMLIRIQEQIMRVAKIDEERLAESRLFRNSDAATGNVEISERAASEPSLPRISYGSFVLGKMVGQGGFGKVYRAHLQQGDELVAVKFLKRKLWQDQSARTALLREVSIVSQLSHHGIIKHLGWGESPHGAPFIVMEFIDGLDLAQWIDQSPRTIAEIISVMLDACQAVAAANDAGVVHCDLTPTNVMIRPNGRALVADFGMAAALTESRSSEFGGTAGFLAPEQISSVFGGRSVRTDVYGIGGLLYWAFSKSAPFSGESREEIIAQVVSSNSAQLAASVAKHLPAELTSLIASCLNKEPGNRPASLHEVIETLRKIVNSTGC